jgi:hypothetical protein
MHQFEGLCTIPLVESPRATCPRIDADPLTSFLGFRWRDFHRHPRRFVEQVPGHQPLRRVDAARLWLIGRASSRHTQCDTAVDTLAADLRDLHVAFRRHHSVSVKSNGGATLLAGGETEAVYPCLGAGDDEGSLLGHAQAVHLPLAGLERALQRLIELDSESGVLKKRGRDIELQCQPLFGRLDVANDELRDFRARVRRDDLQVAPGDAVAVGHVRTDIASFDE